MNLDLDKVVLIYLKELALIRLKNYYRKRDSNTGIILRNIITKEF